VSASATGWLAGLISHGGQSNLTLLAIPSSPIQKVIGEFEVAEIISLSPHHLWESTKKYSGISKKFFEGYFRGKQVGHAIKIKKAKRYRRPLDLNETI
jgi:predicted transcriptional regulator